VQNRPDESLFLVALGEVKYVSNAQEFGADQSLDRGEAERSKRDALRLKDRRLQIGKGGEADIKVSRDSRIA
jgi:hypothetical protein